jgi:hypothetical protein
LLALMALLGAGSKHSSPAETTGCATTTLGVDGTSRQQVTLGNLDRRHRIQISITVETTGGGTS